MCSAYAWAANMTKTVRVVTVKVVQSRYIVLIHNCVNDVVGDGQKHILMMQQIVDATNNIMNDIHVYSPCVVHMYDCSAPQHLSVIFFVA